MDKILKIENNKTISNKLLLFIVFSVLIHGLILMSKLSYTAGKKVSPSSLEKIVKLKLIQNKESSLKKQIVRTEQTANNEKVDKAFLGKKNNKVSRQTRAKNTGKFKTAGIGKKDGSLQKKQVQKNLKKKKKIVSLKDLGFKANPKEYSEKKYKKVSSSSKKGLRNGSALQKGLGQSNDFIEDIPLGDFTKLNTQEFEFYGFYDRIREKLEQFWGRNIEEQSEKIFKQGRSIASDTNHITALEIEINNLGEIVKVDIKSASGIRELDAAAIETFNQAGPFPNPPSKMLKGGKAKIKWSFVVNT